MKKALSLFLSIVMLCSITAGIDLSALAATSGDYEYELLDDGTAEITYYNGSATSLTIPSTLGGYKVTSIGYEAFGYCESLTSVTIPSSVTSIGDGAFYCCYNLASVTIGSGVTTIGEGAFAVCESLASMVIPSSVKSIGYRAFNRCYGLTSITIKSGSIGEEAFRYCTSLKSVTIGSGVTSIGEKAFSGCTSLTSITIGSGVTSIGELAFSGCTSLTSITIPDTITSIGSYAFNSCQSLTSITIPDSVTSIGDYAFYYCTSLASITIPDSVTSIGDYAFSKCTSLKSVTIGSGVKSIGEGAFAVSDADEGGLYESGSLTSITVDTNNKYYSSSDGVLFNKKKTELIQYPVGKTSTSYIIPSGVTSIGCSAFEGCTSLKSITIPSSVTTMGIAAFHCCSSLTDVYYDCSKEQWNKIEFCVSDGVGMSPCIEDKTIHYNQSHSYGSAKYTTKATTDKKGVATYTCTVCGATKTKSYAKIKSVTLSKTSYTYNGKAKTPTVTVKDSNGNTISSKYYTVTYINRSTGKTVSSMKAAGKYYVKIKFKTKYSGTVKKAVTIKPKKTSIKNITAKSKGFTVKWGKVTSCTTGYQVQYSTSKSFSSKTTKTITSNKTTSKKITGLKAKKKYYVRVRTYKTVKINGKSTKIYSSWSSVKSVTTKK